VNTTPPTECAAWAKLAAYAESCRTTDLCELIGSGPARAARLSAELPGLRLDCTRQRIGAAGLDLLLELAAERGFAEWRAALLDGAPINSTERRAAHHTALRAGEAAPPEVKSVLGRMCELAAKLRGDGAIRRVVNIGIGGSDLGPRLLADALGDRALELRFAAGVDPLEMGRALEGAEPRSTLFLVVSKSFTTQETLANAETARRWLGAEPAAKHFIAVTANEPAARAFGAQEILPLWDWVGGRFSVWSAAGFGAMLAVGAEPFGEFLQGAREMDRHFAAAPPARNLPALLALVGVWNVNFLGAATHAVLPYAHGLRLLPAYLQQLEMESNGKRVDREGRALTYATAPVVWGAEGTSSQHSFHQLLHQGTQVVPADFIVAGRSPLLEANAEAQAEALARGTRDPSLPPHRQHPGNRPSSTIALERLDARGLGRLLALYEHKVFTQGVIWNINSFDQWGVELGKQLARDILKRRP
jgi:glucose-6-phosphate isomerase